MKNKAKKIIAIVLACVLVIGGGITALYFAGKSRGTVNVFSVSNMAMTEYWGDANETEGVVRYDNMQAVYLSETQIITGVHVTEGQHVSAGDVLFTFDTTLTDIQLQRKELAIDKLDVEMRRCRERLQELNNMKPYVPPVVTPEEEEPERTPIDDSLFPYLLEETDGTLENPYIVICKADENGEDHMEYTQSLITAFLGGREQCWVVFQTREENSLEGQVLNQWAMTFKNTEGELSFSMIDAEAILPEAPEEEEEQEPVDDSSGFTALEIAEMKREVNRSLKDMDIQMRIEKVELERMRMELETGQITAQFDGVIVTVNDEETARQAGEPLIVLSGGGGFYVDCTVSELNLKDLSVGQMVEVNSWQTGEILQGEIVEIGDMPATQNAYYYGPGNTNVSRYLVTVRIGDDVMLQEYEWVSVSLTPATLQQDSGFYLENSFLRTENGRSYVYVMDEEGILRQRYVKTGANLWGSYTKILDGLTLEECIAFPYGRSVRDGAKAQEADISVLYESMY